MKMRVVFRQPDDALPDAVFDPAVDGDRPVEIHDDVFNCEHPVTRNIDLHGGTFPISDSMKQERCFVMIIHEER